MLGVVVQPPRKTNMTMARHNFDRRQIHLEMFFFSIVMLVFRGVVG